MSKGFLTIAWIGVTASLGAAQINPPRVSARDLLEPDVFPQASFGMAVEAAQDGDPAQVVTTGAEFLFHKAADAIECRQRLAHPRTVATLRLPAGTLADLQLTHHTSGAALFSGGGTTVRVNGDSLLMLSPGQAGRLTAELAFTPDHHAEFQGNHNFFDPDGGISFFVHGQGPGSPMEVAENSVKVAWPWKAGEVFWAAVSPPKPYDWEAPLRNRVVRFGSSEQRFLYPPGLDLRRWSNFGSVLYLHCEAMWKHWQLELIPTNLDEWWRVVGAAHEFGLKVMVYTSPLVFLKGTPIADRATRDLEIRDMTQTTGSRSAENEHLFLAEITRVIKEYGADGLYFDGLYPRPEALATEYHLSRSARDLVGEQGLLEYHATEDALGAPRDGSGCYCPTLHAYYNFILKGEGEEQRMDPRYLRYTLSTYNLSNSVAVACFFDVVPTPEQVDRLLRANVHFHLPEQWFYTGAVEVLRKHYWPRLTPALPQEIAADLQQRTGAFEREIKGR